MKKSLLLCVVVVVSMLAARCICSDAAEPVSIAIAEPALAVAPFDAEQAQHHQQAWSAHRGLPLEWTNSIGMKMVLIPPGEFMLGNSRNEIDWVLKLWPGAFRGPADPEGLYWLENAFPLHRVRITQPFYLAIHEVTQDTYQRVMGVNPSGCKER